MAPRFLELEEVLEIHEDQIARYGGRSGVRDAGLLESAVAMPRAAFGGAYAHSDEFEMAAAYLFHIARNHPFVDGNERAGLASALVFLWLNGWEVPEEPALYELTVRVALGEAGKGDAATALRARSRRRRGGASKGPRR